MYIHREIKKLHSFSSFSGLESRLSAFSSHAKRENFFSSKNPASNVERRYTVSKDLDVGHDRTPVLRAPSWRATNLYHILAKQSSSHQAGCGRLVIGGDHLCKIFQNDFKNTLGQKLTFIRLTNFPTRNTGKHRPKRNQNFTHGAHYRAWKAVSLPFHRARSARFFSSKNSAFNVERRQAVRQDYVGGQQNPDIVPILLPFPPSLDTHSIGIGR